MRSISLQNHNLHSGAGERIRSIIQSGRRPRQSMFFRLWTSDAARGRKPLFFPVVLWIWLVSSMHSWKLPPCDAGNDNARVYCDDLKFIPGVIDHEKGDGSAFHDESPYA